MTGKKMEVSQKGLYEEVQKIVSPLSLKIVELSVKEGRSGITIQLVMDKAGGVKLDDCERVTRLLNDRIEGLHLMGTDNYSLRVSSPGLYRVFKSKGEYEIFASRKVKIILKQPLTPDNQKTVYEGILKGINRDIVLIEVDGVEVKIPYNRIQKTKLNG